MKLTSEAGAAQVFIAEELRKAIVIADSEKDWRTALYLTEEILRLLRLLTSFASKKPRR